MLKLINPLKGHNFLKMSKKYLLQIQNSPLHIKCVYSLMGDKKDSELFAVHPINNVNFKIQLFFLKLFNNLPFNFEDLLLGSNKIINKISNCVKSNRLKDIEHLFDNEIYSKFEQRLTDTSQDFRKQYIHSINKSFFMATLLNDPFFDKNVPLFSFQSKFFISLKNDVQVADMVPSKLIFTLASFRLFNNINDNHGWKVKDVNFDGFKLEK
ncbi:hypothetical protein A3Q56_05133 [Intoshia linei]|uniref:Uncharacterized protein n=1 Tax=Intoshia linei TaxID=1819745 RepID=A0A177B0H7_9BILA|nr:hypothetical protein A3Q56_05133 [Intoshia linei]